MSQKIQRETRANALDCELYRLLNRARDFAEYDSAGRTWWLQAAQKIAEARPFVRHLMSTADRERTSVRVVNEEDHDQHP